MAWYVFDMSWALVSFFSFVCFFTLLTFLLVDCHYSITATQWHQKKGLSPGNLFFLFLFYLLTQFYLEPTHGTRPLHRKHDQMKKKKENKRKLPKRCWHQHLLGCRSLLNACGCYYMLFYAFCMTVCFLCS